MLMMGWRLDDDATAHDVLAEPFEPRDELTNASLERERWLHLTERDLQRKSHHQLLATPGAHDFSERHPCKCAQVLIQPGININPDGIPAPTA